MLWQRAYSRLDVPIKVVGVWDTVGALKENAASVSQINFSRVSGHTKSELA